jgi:hypothetical protein
MHDRHRGVDWAARRTVQLVRHPGTCAAGSRRGVARSARAARQRHTELSHVRQQAVQVCCAPCRQQ